MDEREFRPSPVANPTGQWMLPSDRMVIRRFKNLDHLDKILQNGFHAKKADEYEKLEGRASPATLQQEEKHWELKGLDEFQDGSAPDISTGMYETRKAARHYYYPSCWRIGTSEDRDIWKCYTGIDEENKRGIGFETTVGQIKQHLQPDEKLYMGAVWYQRRETEYTSNFPFFDLYFFKDQEFDREQEFRALANRNGNPPLMLDGREWTENMLPEDQPSAAYLKGDLDTLINRVIVAPEAGDDIWEEVEETLSEFSIDAEIIGSQLEDSGEFTGEYMAELRGPTNYSQSAEYLNFCIEQWHDSTDWGEWSTIDVVRINQQNNRAVGRTLVELYRYRDEGPDFGVYGQDHLNYQVQAHRFDEDDRIDYFENKWARKFEETQRVDVSRIYMITDISREA